MTKQAIRVVGFGNPLRGDEGIGPRLIEDLRALWEPDGEGIQCEFLDLGTSGMRLLNVMVGVDKLLVVDCAFMGLQPGEIRQFTLSGIETIKTTSQLSFHDLDLVKILALAQRLGESLPEVIFVGIEPESIGFQWGLSAVLEQRVPDYLAFIRGAIANSRPSA